MNSLIHSEEATRPRPRYTKNKNSSIEKPIRLQGAETRHELSWCEIQRAPMISKTKIPFWELKSNPSPSVTIFTSKNKRLSDESFV